MKCNYCGADMEDTALFCNRCGKAVSNSTMERHCGYCGAKLEAEASFCWRCGKSAPPLPKEKDQSPDRTREKKKEQTNKTGPSDEKAALKARTEALVLAAQAGMGTALRSCIVSTIKRSMPWPGPRSSPTRTPRTCCKLPSSRRGTTLKSSKIQELFPPGYSASP